MQSTDESLFDVREFLPFLDPLIQKWFNSKYSSITEPQRKAIPLIHDMRNVLVSSPTGTGKTLTGFLSVINELFILSRGDKLEDRIYCLYISPLKALANDINKNLNQPIDEIREIARLEGLKFPPIRASVRTGDTPQSERQKMLRKPPHILITTPESFSLALSAPKFKEKLKDLKYVIIDEIHEISSTKRGALLSLNMERLAEENRNFVRIGLSATQAPIEIIASYLCGYENDEPRPCEIIEVDTKKYLDLSTITPVNDLTKASYEVANDRMYEVLAQLINEHKATIVFTNTRSGTENVAMRLKARGIENIEAHHSSLGKETRIEVENKLKNGELKCVITSTSLELGIDVGYIDLVVQIGSPKSVSKGLQRIGRSGHGINDLSKGRFIVFDLDDLMECAVLTKAAYDRNIDRVTVPENSLDVLSQILVGMSLEKVYNDKDAYRIVRNSYNYHTLTYQDYIETLNYLAGQMESSEIYAKIWYDREQGTFGKRRSTRMLYFMNIGTIPEEADYKVINDKGRHLGQLSDKFAERLKTGDIFVLGARTYMYMRTVQNRIYVKDATGMRPTVPSWSGEMLPRSYDLGVLVGKFREEVRNRINTGMETELWLMENYHLDRYGARSIISYVETQAKFDLPTDNHLLVEGYVDKGSIYSMIFHVPLGRRVNDALSRAYAQAISNRYGSNMRVTITDDGFMLGSEKRVPIRDAISLIDSSNFYDYVSRSISNTEVFKQRFRHCATRSLMVLRKYKGYDISIVRQQLRSDKLLKALDKMSDFPVIKETYHEIMNLMMDVPRATGYVRDVIERGRFHIIDYSEETSPFSYGLILAGVSDMVLMEDRAHLLRELQSKILDKIYGPGNINVLIPDQKKVEEYFRLKVPRVTDAETFMGFANHFLYFDAFKSRYNSPFPYAETGVTDIIEELIENERIISVNVRGSYWTTPEHYQFLRTLVRKEIKLDIEIQTVLDHIAGKTYADLKRETKIDEQKIRDAVSALEAAFVVRRSVVSGKQVFMRNDLEERAMEPDHAAQNAIQLILGSYGPLTFDELLIRLPVHEDLLRSNLETLTAKGILVYDFITPVFAKQYILRNDLESIMGGGNEFSIDSRVINFMGSVETLEEYFEKYGYCYGEQNLIQRVNNYKRGDLMKHFESGFVSYGRFIRNRHVFVAKWLSEALHSLRSEKLKDEELKVFNLVERGLSSETMLVKHSDMEAKLIRQLIKNLEFHLLIQKSPTGDIIPLNSLEPSLDKKEAISLLVSRFGPISRKELMQNFWFYADSPLKEANIKGIPVRNDIYYGFREQGSTSDSSGVFNILDPLELYLGKKYFREISYNMVFIANGKEEGTLDLKESTGVLWVTQLSVPDKLMGKAISDISRLSVKMGLKAVCIEIPRTAIEPELIPDIPDDFRRTGNYIINGDYTLSPVDLEDIFAYASTRRSHIEGTAVYEDIKGEFLGFRNEIEASYAGLRNMIYRAYFQSRLLFQFSGPFSVQTLGAMETISLYRALKGVSLTAEDQQIIHAIIDLGGATEAQVKGYLIKSGINIKERLAHLYSSCIIARDFDRKYVFVPEKYTIEEAAGLLLPFLLKRMGYFDTEILDSILGESHVVSSEKIASMLPKYSEVVKCVLPLEKRIIYLNSGLIGRGFKYKGSRIIAPKDILTLYFQPLIKRETGSLNSYILVEAGRIVASISASKSMKTLKVSSFQGVDEKREKIASELNSLGFAVSFGGH